MNLGARTVSGMRRPVLYGVGSVLAGCVVLSLVGLEAGPGGHQGGVQGAATASAVPTPVAEPVAGSFAGVDVGCESVVIRLASIGVRMFSESEELPPECAGFGFARALVALVDAVDLLCTRAVMEGSVRVGVTGGGECDGFRAGHVMGLIGSFGPSATPSASPVPTGLSS